MFLLRFACKTLLPLRTKLTHEARSENRNRGTGAIHCCSLATLSGMPDSLPRRPRAPVRPQCGFQNQTIPGDIVVFAGAD